MAINYNYGNVFIAWAGADTGRKVARKVQKALEGSGYTGIVGGDSLHTKGTSSVGESIFEEIDECVTAIVLASKPNKNDPNALSFNTAIEWGYCHNRFEGQEEAFLINGFKLDDFDIRGWNSTPIEENIEVDFNNEEQLDRIAREIVVQFVAKQEAKREEAEDNYLKLINDYTTVEREMKDLETVSPYELGKRIMLYAQSAYIFHRLNDSEIAVNNFKSSHTLTDPFLSLAVDYALTSFHMFSSVSANKGKKSIEEREFASILGELEAQLSRAELLEDQPLKWWLIVSITKNLSYVYYIKAVDPNTDVFNSADNSDYCSRHGNRCIELCEKLYGEKETYKLYSRLVKYYMYRNFYSLAVAKNFPIEKAENYASEARNAVMEVYNYVKGNQSFQEDFINNIKTEYNVSIAINIKYAKNKAMIPGTVENLDAFYNEITKTMRRRLSSLEYIKTVIDKEQIKLFIFDFDLTIADTVEASKYAYEAAFNAIGSSFDRDNKRKLVEYLGQHLYNTYLLTGKPQKDYEVFLKTYIDTFEKHLDKVVLYPDAIEFINLLISKNKKVVIYSNRDEKTIRDIITKNDIIKEAYIDKKVEIVSAGTTKTKRKSSDDIVDFMTNNGLDPKNDKDKTIYFGDSDEDKATAVCADVKFVRVDRHSVYTETKFERLSNFSTFFK